MHYFPNETLKNRSLWEFRGRRGSWDQNHHWKLGQQTPSVGSWNSLGLYRDYGLNYIFFRNKTFLFFKIEKLKISASVWKKNCETLQNFKSFSWFRQFLFPYFLSVVWLSWNFVRFHEILFQTDVESFSFLPWKTKKVLFLKKI